MTMVKSEPRQIVGFDATWDKCAWRIQDNADSGSEAEKYCADGYVGYLDVIYPGQRVRNMRDKSDTCTVEGVNADLRHDIPLFKRRSRCSARSLEALQAVMAVFADAYNRFGRQNTVITCFGQPVISPLPLSIPFKYAVEHSRRMPALEKSGRAAYNKTYM